MNGAIDEEAGSPWEAAISIPIILELYDEVMSRYGGKRSAPKNGCLESCLGSAWNAEHYSDPEGVELGPIFAVHLMLYLAWNHCFTDGNKRIAWVCLVYVLSHHALMIFATAEEIERLMDEIVKKEKRAQEVIDWLGGRLRVREI